MDVFASSYGLIVKSQHSQHEQTYAQTQTDHNGIKKNNYLSGACRLVLPLFVTGTIAQRRYSGAMEKPAEGATDAQDRGAVTATEELDFQ